jgi:hypothetical protein
MGASLATTPPRRWMRRTTRICLAAMLAASALAGLMTETPAQAATPAWTIPKSPNATLPGGRIESVSCSSASACTAVGTYLDTSGINVTLAEAWNGTSWHQEATPNPPGDVRPEIAPDLFGVSCPTAHFCAAVGSYQNVSTRVVFAETWNGIQCFALLGLASGRGERRPCPGASLPLSRTLLRPLSVRESGKDRSGTQRHPA